MAYQRIVAPDGATSDLVRREADGAIVPADALNADWQAYQAWLEAGNTPKEPRRASPVRRKEL